MMNMKMTSPRLAKALRICVTSAGKEHRRQGRLPSWNWPRSEVPSRMPARISPIDGRLTDSPEEPAEQSREDHHEDDRDEHLGGAVGKRRRRRCCLRGQDD